MASKIAFSRKDFRFPWLRVTASWPNKQGVKDHAGKAPLMIISLHTRYISVETHYN